MSDSVEQENSKAIKYVWIGFILIFAAGSTVSIAYLNHIKKESLVELSHEQEELAHVESIVKDNEALKAKWTDNRQKLSDSERALLREIRSFRRPKMKAALVDRLQLPKENCVFSVIESTISNSQSMLVYASEPGQKLSIPVWDSDVEFKGQVRKEPKHQFELDITPGKIHRVKVGMQGQSWKDPKFIVRFNDEELLSINLEGSELHRTSVAGSPDVSLFLPGRIANVLDGFQHKEIELKLFRKGLWLKQGDMYFNMRHMKMNTNRHIKFCIYWLTAGERFVSDIDAYRLPSEVQDDFLFEERGASATLRRVVPK
jgi:hypothetical protein